MAQAFDIDPAFDDIDYGRWSGHSIREIGEKEPENIATWLADPYSHPHGGESVAVLAARVIDGSAHRTRGDTPAVHRRHACNRRQGGRGACPRQAAIVDLRDEFRAALVHGAPTAIRRACVGGRAAACVRLNLEFTDRSK
ncbi:Probable phosphoglycerate mutase [Candidatus Paraburkholderia kirkii UZHbot1]|uniref:Probable phosphoglycerate mutase n=1 Tax=Candidatus Paraburkholderia kirkii UZHbot1 TaxID=1055526 RepID=G4MEL9_9BURK|nr:Probable phosphoglycerate mutase [Candidatus Paraburkholderia kirkii UZHbot1]